MPLSPFVEVKLPPVSGTFVTGSDTREIDHLRQGVEISDPRMRLLGTLPKASAGTDNHQIPQTSFGQPKEFQDDTGYTDMTTLRPTTHIAGGNLGLSYPITDRNPSYADLNDMDGAIEALTIRARASRNSVEWPFDSHAVKGQVMGGNEDHLKRTDRIVDEYEFPTTTDIDPFIDSAEAFGLTATSSVILPGFSSDLERRLRPFSDGAPTLVGATGTLHTYLLSSSTGISGTHAQDPGYIGFDKVSTTKGFEYQSARRSGRTWTDSLAFGDREEYAPRGYLASLDQTVGAYPTVVRTGDPGRRGNRKIFYDDTRHIVFSSGSQIVNIGRNLQPSNYFLGTSHLTSTYIRADSRGNTYPLIGQTRIVTTTAYPVTTQSTNITIRAGIADTGIRFSQDETQLPYDDSRIHVGIGMPSAPQTPDIFYFSGTSESEYPGFSSRLSSKTSFKIDLTPVRDHFLYRISTPRINNLIGANTPEFATGSTGFAYFNHVLRRWEDIGLIDPATGKDRHYDYCVTTATAAGPNGGYAASGTNNFPCQFAMSPQTVAGGNGATEFVTDNVLARAWGYDKIGTPTNSCFAPFATMYHATRSQALQMSDYISHPFLLERAVLKIDLVARKIHHIDTVGLRSDNDQRRDIDNYVFFMYRQSHIQDPKNGRDSATDVSGSIRNLICSASFTFWNKPTVAVGYTYSGGTALSTGDLNKWPLHGPAYAHNWDFGVNAATPAHNVAVDNKNAVITASVTIPIKIAVAPRQLFGASSFPGQERVGAADVQEVVKFQNAWIGATSQYPFMNLVTGFTGKQGVTSSIVKINPGVASVYAGKYSAYDPGVVGAAGSQTMMADGRSFRSLGGNSPFGSTANSIFGIFSNGSVSGSAQSIVAPYVLMPTDELVFGFDAGISQFMNGASLGLTGSFLKILSRQASITLFGSMIREGVEYHDTLNQNLTSPAVHEAIYSDTVVDQFEVENRSLFSGSYIDSLVTGTLTPGGGRGIAASAVAEPGGINSIGASGSLFRGMTATNGHERFYDSIPPEIVGYLQATNRVSLIGVSDAGVATVTLDPAKYFAESGTYRMPYPYNNELARVDHADDKRIRLVTNVGAGATITGKSLRQALFKIAEKVGRPDVTGENPHADNGAMAFRYGLWNIEPSFTRAVFRYNKFGQFRDMLEQRIDTKFQLSANPENGTVNGTIQGPVFIRFKGGNPVATNTSNLSVEATSSLPYFDGVVRNRESPLNTGLMNATTVELL